MKKFTMKIITMICIIGCLLSMAACGEHIHDYDGAWMSNSTQHWHECKNDGCNEKEKDKGEHIDENNDGKCDVCEYVMSEEHTHSLIKHEAKEATCEEEGNEAYYECDECGKWYKDENGEDEILDKNSVILQKKGHVYVDGICSICGKNKPRWTEGLEYIINGDEACVNGIGSATDKDIVIASEYNGKPVTKIGESVFENCDITSVVIPNSVTNIGEYAFYNCKELIDITIPDSVAVIDGYSFMNTAWYKNQPDGLIYIGKVAYMYKGTMPSNTSIVLQEGTKGIAGYAFLNCVDLVNIAIPNSVTSMGHNAFYGCVNLVNITIPNSVTSIGHHAFCNCRGLKSITIGDGVTSIGDFAFYNCVELVEITIPNGVTSIGEGMFGGCEKLTDITIPVGMASFKSAAFEKCLSLTNILYDGTISQWDDIVKERGWDDNAGFYTVFCMDGEIKKELN